MLLVRRKVTRSGAFTVLMLPDYYREWPTSEREHQDILKIFKQDGHYKDIVNDFSEFRLGEDAAS